MEIFSVQRRYVRLEARITRTERGQEMHEVDKKRASTEASLGPPRPLAGVSSSGVNFKYYPASKESHCSLGNLRFATVTGGLPPRPRNKLCKRKLGVRCGEPLVRSTARPSLPSAPAPSYCHQKHELMNKYGTSFAYEYFPRFPRVLATRVFFLPSDLDRKRKFRE